MKKMSNCASKKIEYLSKELAEDALIDQHVRKNFNAGDGPLNVYLCDHCHHWHLTSSGNLNGRLKQELESGKLKLKQRAFRLEEGFNY